MRTKRYDGSQRSDRFAVTQPMRPPLGRPEKQLTGWADRPVRDPMRAGAFTIAVVIGCAGSVHRRTPVRTARALLVDRNRAASPTATKASRQNIISLAA